VLRPSAASASSNRLPAKDEPSSITAKRLRDETSRRCRVRRSKPIVSRTNQWSRWAAIVASQASTASGSPEVFSTHVPIS